LKPGTLSVLGLFALLLSLFTVPAASAQSIIALDPTTTARIRIIHAAPEAPNVDVYVDDVKKLANVPFFTISDYLTITAGTRNLKVNVAGTATTVINATAPVAAGGVSTIAVVKAAIGSPSPVQLVTLADDLTLPTTGFARMRVYHFSPGTPPVQIRLNNGPVLVPNLAYPEATGGLLVATGSYTLEVALAAGGASEPAVLTLPNVLLEAGKLYDFFAIGKGAGLRIESRVTNTTAKVRIIHASPDASPVDVYVDGAKVLSNVPFFTISDYLEVPAGSRQLAVTLTGQPLSSAPLTLTPTLDVGRFYSVSAIGFVGGAPALQAKVSVDDLSTTAPGTSRVRVYHFSPDSPTVGVRVKNGEVLIPSLSFPQISADIEIPAGTYDLELFLPTLGNIPVPLTPEQAAALTGLKLDSGRIYDIFAADRLSNIKIVSRIYGPNATAPYQVYLPQVTLE